MKRPGKPGCCLPRSREGAYGFIGQKQKKHVFAQCETLMGGHPRPSLCPLNPCSRSPAASVSFLCSASSAVTVAAVPIVIRPLPTTAAQPPSFFGHHLCRAAIVASLNNESHFLLIYCPFFCHLSASHPHGLGRHASYSSTNSCSFLLSLRLCICQQTTTHKHLQHHKNCGPVY
jgi:hypothetical protein